MCLTVGQETGHEEVIQLKCNTTFLNRSITIRILLVKSKWRSEIQRLLSTISVILWPYSVKKIFLIPGRLPKLSFSSDTVFFFSFLFFFLFYFLLLCCFFFSPPTKRARQSDIHLLKEFLIYLKKKKEGGVLNRQNQVTIVPFSNRLETRNFFQQSWVCLSRSHLSPVQGRDPRTLCPMQVFCEAGLRTLSRSSTNAASLHLGSE